MKPNPRSLLMKTSLIFPYLANMFLNSSSGIFSGRLPIKRRERCVKVFSPGFRKLVISRVISAGLFSLPSPAPSICSAAGDCCCGGAELSLFAGVCSEAGESVPRLAGWGELLLCMVTCCVFRLSMRGERRFRNAVQIKLNFLEEACGIILMMHTSRISKMAMAACATFYWYFTRGVTRICVRQLVLGELQEPSISTLHTLQNYILIRNSIVISQIA